MFGETAGSNGSVMKWANRLTRYVGNDGHPFMLREHFRCQSTKKEAIQAVMDISAELEKQQPNEQKIKSIWEPIQKTSSIAAICSAICDLVDMILS